MGQSVQRLWRLRREQASRPPAPTPAFSQTLTLLLPPRYRTCSVVYFLPVPPRDGSAATLPSIPPNVRPSIFREQQPIVTACVSRRPPVLTRRCCMPSALTPTLYCITSGESAVAVYGVQLEKIRQ